MTIKQKHHEQKEKVQIQAHNRVKQYILKEGVPVPFLIDLGVMNEQERLSMPDMTNSDRSIVSLNLLKIYFPDFPETEK